jgi:hypothetical protein
LSGTKDGLALGGVPRRKHPGRVAPRSLKSAHFFEVKSGVSNTLSFAPELDSAGFVWTQSRPYRDDRYWRREAVIGLCENRLRWPSLAGTGLNFPMKDWNERLG